MRGGSAESTIRNGASFGSGARPSRFRNAGSTARRRKRRNGCGTSCDASESASGTRSSTGSTPRGRTNRTSAPSARSGLSKEPGYDAGNPRPGRPIAVRVWPVPLRPELLAGGIEDPDRIRPREDVRADVQRLGPFRALPKGHAGNTEEARLLLEPARVREDESGVPLELEHVEVPRRRDHLYPRGLEKGVQPVLFRHLLGAGMDRKDDREPVAGGDRAPPLEDPPHPVRAVDGVRAVEREGRGAAPLDAGTLQDCCRLVCRLRVLHEGVNHAVPDDV